MQFSLSLSQASIIGLTVIIFSTPSTLLTESWLKHSTVWGVSFRAPLISWVTVNQCPQKMLQNPTFFTIFWDFGPPDIGAGVEFFQSFFCIAKLFQGALKLQKTGC
jgi:hypothetical protein